MLYLCLSSQIWFRRTSNTKMAFDSWGYNYFEILSQQKIFWRYEKASVFQARLIEQWRENYSHFFLKKSIFQDLRKIKKRDNQKLFDVFSRFSTQFDWRKQKSCDNSRNWNEFPPQNCQYLHFNDLKHQKNCLHVSIDNEKKYKLLFELPS